MKFTFNKHLLLRSPVYPYKALLNPHFPATTDPFFTEAVYYASPSFARRRQEWSSMEKQKLTLYRYLNRMSTRCVPFGLFASISSLEWGPSTKINLGAIKKKAFPSSSLFFKHQSHNELLYRISLNYILQGSFYYFSIGEDDSLIHLQSLPVNEFLNYANAEKKPKRHVDWVRTVEQFYEVSTARARGFVDRLIEENIFVQVHSPFFCKSNEKMKEQLGVHDSLILKRSLQLSEEIEQGSIPVNEAVMEMIREFPAIAEKTNRLFFVSTHRDTESNRVDSDHQHKMLQAIDVLSKLSVKRSNESITEFIRAFKLKYGSEAVPLLQAIDPVNGLGYGANRFEEQNHINKSLGITNQPPVDKMTISKAHFRLYEQALMHGKKEVSISDEFIRKYGHKPTTKWRLAPSYTTFFSLIDEGNQDIAMHYIGSNAHTSISKYDYDPEVKEQIKKSANHEKEVNPEVIFADIIYYPDQELCDILYHERIYDYAIPVLTSQELDYKYCINLESILVTIQDEEIILFDAQKRKRVIPRLCHPYNYHKSGFSVFRFLIDVSNQFIPDINFSWGELINEAGFLPRVSYKTVVLSPAQWSIPITELKDSCGSKFSYEKVVNVLRGLNVPQLTLSGEDDQQLLLDLDCPMSVFSWWGINSNRKFANLTEWMNPSPAIKDNFNQVYTHQIAATLLNNDTVYQPCDLEEVETASCHLPKSKCIYLKLFSFPANYDNLLYNHITPYIYDLRNKDLINLSYFICYDDDEKFHIRWRMYVQDFRKIETVERGIARLAQRLLETGLVYDFSFATFRPEYKRYGGKPTFNLVEQWFYYDSITTAEMLRSHEVIYHHWIG